MATLAENDRHAGPYVAGAGQTDFPADFPVVDPAGVSMQSLRGGVATTLVNGVGFDIVAATDASFTGRLRVGAQAGDLVSVYSELALVRPQALTPGGAVRTDVYEGDMTRVVAQQQDLRRTLGDAAAAAQDTASAAHDAATAALGAAGGAVDDAAAALETAAAAAGAVAGASGAAAAALGAATTAAATAAAAAAAVAAKASTDLSNVTAGAVGSGLIAGGAVTGPKLAAGAAATNLGFTPADTNLGNVSNAGTARTNINAANRSLGDVTRIANVQIFSGLDTNNSGVHVLAVTDVGRTVASPNTSFLSSFVVAGGIGGSTLQGGRNHFLVNLNMTAPVPNSGNSNMVAETVLFNVQAPFTAGSGVARGAVFAGNDVIVVGWAASPAGEVLVNSTCREFDSDVHAPVLFKSIIQLAQSDGVQGSFADPMINFGALGNTAIGKKSGMTFLATDPYSGVPIPPPLDSSIGQVANSIGAQAVQDVFNFNSMTASRHILTANSGQIQLSNSGGLGQLNLRAATNIVSLGSLTAAGQSTLQFFSSGHGGGVVDSSIAGIGGSATVGGGVIAFTAAQMVVPTIRPGADNASDYGTASFRIRDLFLANPPTVTSDARLKHVVGDLADAEFDKLLDAVGSVRLVLFQWLTAMAEKGDAARLHAGVLAQELRDAIAAQGLDPARFGVFCEDELHESVEIEEAVEVPDTEDATEEHQVVEIVDGKAVRRTVVETYQKPKMQTVPLFNEDGSRAMFPKVDQRVRHSPMTDEEGRPLLTKAGTPRMKRHVQKGLPARPATHDVPVTKTVTRKTPSTRPVLDDQGLPVRRLGVRSDQLYVLLFAWTRRALRRFSAAVA